MQVKCKYCGTRFDAKDKYCPYCYARVNEKKHYREDGVQEVERVRKNFKEQNRQVRRTQSKRQNVNARYSRNTGSSVVNRVIMIIVFVWIFMIFISIISNLMFFF